MERPDFVAYLWEWFIDLHGGRQYTNEGAALPFSFESIKAWSELMNTSPSVYEIRILKQLDNIFISTK